MSDTSSAAANAGLDVMRGIWSQITGDMVSFVGRLLLGITILVVAFQLDKRLPKLLDKVPILKRADAKVLSMLMTTMSLLLKLAGVVCAGLLIGIPESAVITLLGSAGVALGLALQGSLSNLAGGLMLLFFRPFEVGDYINAGEYEGTVTQISAFYTTMRTIDSRRVVLPNGNLTNSALVNYTAEGRRQLELKFSVAYKEDIDRTREAMMSAVDMCELVLRDPEPTIPITSLNDSAVEFTVRAWVDCANVRAAQGQLIELVKRALDRENIEIPFPQLDIHTR